MPKKYFDAVFHLCGSNEPGSSVYDIPLVHAHYYLSISRRDRLSEVLVSSFSTIQGYDYEESLRIAVGPDRLALAPE